MTLILLKKSVIIFGAVTEDRHRSMNERMANRNYIGEWRWESQVTVITIRRFPNTIPA